MNCTICKSKIQETFLRKIEGTYVKDSKSKKKPVCKSCQSKLTLEEIKEKL
ncbi:MAG: hypothetical protein WC758_01750 [Candidatus Woesearchaeota archaeon]|jgi:hypothetical protein